MPPEKMSKPEVVEPIVPIEDQKPEKKPKEKISTNIEDYAEIIENLKPEKAEYFKKILNEGKPIAIKSFLKNFERQKERLANAYPEKDKQAKLEAKEQTEAEVTANEAAAEKKAISSLIMKHPHLKQNNLTEEALRELLTLSPEGQELIIQKSLEKSINEAKEILKQAKEASVLQVTVHLTKTLGPIELKQQGVSDVNEFIKNLQREIDQETLHQQALEQQKIQDDLQKETEARQQQAKEKAAREKEFDNLFEKNIKKAPTGEDFESPEAIAKAKAMIESEDQEKIDQAVFEIPTMKEKTPLGEISITGLENLKSKHETLLEKQKITFWDKITGTVEQKEQRKARLQASIAKIEEAIKLKEGSITIYEYQKVMETGKASQVQEEKEETPQAQEAKQVTPDSLENTTPHIIDGFNEEITEEILDKAAKKYAGKSIPELKNILLGAKNEAKRATKGMFRIGLFKNSERAQKFSKAAAILEAFIIRKEKEEAEKTKESTE